MIMFAVDFASPRGSRGRRDANSERNRAIIQQFSDNCCFSTTAGTRENQQFRLASSRQFGGGLGSVTRHFAAPPAFSRPPPSFPPRYERFPHHWLWSRWCSLRG